MTVYLEYKPLDNIGVGLINLTYVSELILNWILFVKRKFKLMVVYVLDITGNPLMPTHNFGKVRRMLRNGRAIVVNRNLFTIKLTYVSTTYTQDITLGVDAGSVHVGLSASTTKEELFSAEVDLRSKEIKKLLDKKKETRQTRRSHLRHRQARFDNRTASKKDGWLPPSIQHRIDSHVRIVEDVMRILPITKIIVEIAIFDAQKISNPEISGEEYQNGQMTGFDNVKAFVRFRDKHRCQQCGREEHIEVHHIQHREDGGSDRPDNLVCLCHECHYKHHSKELVLKKFRNLNKKNAVTLRDAAAMNIIKDRILSELNNRFQNIPVRKTYGFITSYNRKKYNIDKSHANDAFVIVKNFNAKPLEYMFKGKQVRRHNRRIYKDNILKGNIRKLNQAPHLVFRFALNDRVKFNGMECFVHARRSKGYFELKDIEGNRIHTAASVKKIKFISHENSIILKKISKNRKD